VNYQRES